ncbi:MAG: MBOAT family protein [Lachnospiraceae bacterium]|nr:MBOAT family protein [Lachnospiraceae bacterium]
MLFNSYIFILIFIPLCLIGYFLFNHIKQYTVAQCFLLGMSLWFYGYFNIKYLAIIVASILINYILYILIGRFRETSKGKIFTFLGIAVNLGILGFFKYTDFFLDSINHVFKTNIPLLHILLPLGISFFTFQQISFIADTYKGEVKKYSFIHYASFVAFFPQLIAGPIVTHDELITQFLDESKKKFDPFNFSKGLFMFTIGLSKKVLIADVFGSVVNYGYVAPERLNTLSAWIVILSYTFQIYFDFSGYCDMAVGLAKMFNLDLPINFNSPYKSATIEDFWDRWHMTLTRFFTRYVYIPLGGNRKGKARTLLNVFIVFLLSGFWHGAGWTFVIWGMMHGILVILTKLIRKPLDKFNGIFSGFSYAELPKRIPDLFAEFLKKIPGMITWIPTFFLVNMTWVFFRAESVKDALFMLKKAFTLNTTPLDTILINAFKTKEITQLMNFTGLEYKFPNLPAYAFILLAFVIAVALPNSKKMFDKFKPNVLTLIFTIVFFTWSFLSLSGVSTFLYFNF